MAKSTASAIEQDGHNKNDNPPPMLNQQDKQYQLFTQFVANANDAVSNTVELWESIPKYFFTAAQMDELRHDDSGLAGSFRWQYRYQNLPCEVVIQPALIRQEDGSEKAFFPSVTEELVEEALKKILTIQSNGAHDSTKQETWIRFSLRMLKRELDSRHRGRSVVEIKHAIAVMSGCVITMLVEGKELWRGSILQDLTTVGRAEYESEDGDSYHFARLPLFISQSITRLDYRQFNFAQLMDCDTPLARYIYKRLVNRFAYASHTQTHHFKFSSLKDSGFLQRSRERDNRVKVEEALNELQRRGVLVGFEAKPTMSGRRVIDVTYTLFPGDSFIRDQKAANKAQSVREAQADELKLTSANHNDTPLLANGRR